MSFIKKHNVIPEKRSFHGMNNIMKNRVGLIIETDKNAFAISFLRFTTLKCCGGKNELSFRCTVLIYGEGTFFYYRHF